MGVQNSSNAMGVERKTGLRVVASREDGENKIASTVNKHFNKTHKFLSECLC